MATQPNKSRKPIAALAVTTALALGVSQHEGFRDKAYMPTPDDRPTLGLGSTFHPDGRPVQMGETITKERAIVYLHNDLNKFANAVKRCAPVPMHDYEFAAFVSITYNIGETNFCRSTMARKLKQFDYQGACDAMLAWDKQAGKTLRGLTRRRQEERDICLGKYDNG
jgi:lysozyme